MACLHVPRYYPLLLELGRRTEGRPRRRDPPQEGAGRDAEGDRPERGPVGTAGPQHPGPGKGRGGRGLVGADAMKAQEERDWILDGRRRIEAADARKNLEAARKAHGEAATDRQRVWSGNYEHSWHAPTPRLAPEAHRLDASERPGAGPRPD